MKKALIGLGVIAGLGLLAWGFFSMFPGLLVKQSLMSEVPAAKQAIWSVMPQDKKITEGTTTDYVNNFEHRDISFKIPGNGTYEIKRPTAYNTKIVFSTGRTVGVLGPLPGESTVDAKIETAKTSIDDLRALTPANEAASMAERLVAKPVLFLDGARDMYVFDTGAIRGLYYSYGADGSIVAEFTFKDRPEGDMALTLKGFDAEHVDYILGSIRRK